MLNRFAQTNFYMKEGLVFIDHRTDQIRYATRTNQDAHTDNNIDEKYIQPLSVYYAAEDILRGQPVSPALLEDIPANYAKDPYPYVSLTDTSKHTKCLGLAIEPAKAGEAIHIQSYGRFNYDDQSFISASNNLSEEYYPVFGHDLFSQNTIGNIENGPSKSLMYKNLIGKQVFVRSRIANKYQAKDDINVIKGELTVDEKETYYGNHNVIQVGFIVDAPVNDKETSLSIEIQLEGDGRGPLENTQWELKTGEEMLIGSNEQTKVFAIGKENPSPFKALVSCVIPPNDKSLHNYDFIALQRIDGKTCFITFDDSITTFESLRNAVAANNNTEDLAFVNVAQMYSAAAKNTYTDTSSSIYSNIKVLPINSLIDNFLISIENLQETYIKNKVDLNNNDIEKPTLTIEEYKNSTEYLKSEAYKYYVQAKNVLEARPINYKFSTTNLEYNIEAIVLALSYAYNYVCELSDITISSIKYDSIKETYYDKSVDIEEKIYSKYAEVYATKNLGYVEMYISQELKSKFFIGSTTISRGSAGNKGKAVLADIRLGERQEIAGLYFNRNYNITLPVNSDVIALHQGQFTISSDYEDAPRFIPGATYYLGSNGNITTTPLSWTDSIVKIGVATDNRTLLVDCADCRQYDVGTLPVGYMKPSIENKTEYGFLLMDGGSLYEEGLSVTDESGNEIIEKNRYEVDRYNILFNRLRAIYSKEELNYIEGPLTYTYNDGTSETKSKTFIIPKVVYSNGCFAQIKWLEEGIFAQIPRIPYVRNIGVFPDNKKGHNAPFIETIDISALVHYGPRDNSVYEVNLEDLDLHLYIDLNSENRYVVHTETLYSASKDSSDFYYDKQLTQVAQLREDETLHLESSIDENVSDTLQESPVVWTATYTETSVENDAYPNWVEVYPGFNLFNNNTYSGFQWKITPDRIAPKDGSDPFIKFYLDTDIGNYTNEKGEVVKGLGIAYKQNPWQPPKLCNGLRYKVFVGRHEYNNRKVDINNMFRNSMSNEILNSRTGKPTSAPVTGEAVYNFITSINTRDESTINNHLKVGDEKSFAKVEMYLKDPSFIRGKITLFDDKKETSTVINGSDISISNFKTYKSFADLMKDNNTQSLLTVGSIQSAFNKKDENGNNIDLLKDIFGISNNGFGGINAEKLSSLKIGNGRDAQITDSSNIKGWIPFVNTINTADTFTIGKNITYDLGKNKRVYKDFEDVSDINSAYSIIQEKISLNNNAAINDNVQYNIVYNFNPIIDNTQEASDNKKYDIEFKKIVGNTKGYASVKVGTLVYGSSIKIKNLYNTNLREYDADLDKEYLYGSRNNFDSISITSNEEQAAERLTSALQAAYELPLGLWSYKQDESWRKRYLGIIVEQVAYVRDKGLTIDTIRSITNKKDYKKPEFTYTNDEVNSIQSFLKLITDDAESGQNAITTMGILLAAARETQERLLKLEASTFGRDAESIPGDKFEITKGIETALPDKEINQTPTYIGLNRIVRALCKEVFNSYDPETAAGLSPTVGSYRARLQDIYTQIEGTNGGQNDLDNYKKGNALNPLNNSNDWYTQSGYYKGTEEENVNDNERNIKEAAQRNTYPIDVKLTPNTDNVISNAKEIEDQGPFNGLNDAMNRVVQKLNVLTAEVNGVDNINAGPIKLNQIRENVKTAINELFFNEYIDTQDLYSPSASRLDEIEKVLFRNRNITATEILNKNYPDVGRLPSRAKDYSTYENVIDLIISTLGNDIVPLMNIGINNVDIDTATKRLYYPVSERLFNIEKALDTLVKSLNNKETNDSYSDIGINSSFTVIEFVNELMKFLGMSYHNGLWEYNVKNNNEDVENFFGNHTNFYAIGKDIYDRLKKVENTLSIIKDNLGNYYNSNGRYIGKDVENLYKTIYDNRDVSNNFTDNNIIEKIVNALYYIDPRSKDHSKANMASYKQFDSNNPAGIDKESNYKYVYNNETTTGTYEECLKKAKLNKDYSPTFYKIDAKLS